MALPSAYDLYTMALNNLQGAGNAQQGSLYQSYRNSMGQGMQSLAGSGLAHTSIAPSMRMGYMRQYQQSLNELGQQLQQQRNSVYSTFGLGGLQLENSQKALDLQAEMQRKSMALQEKQYGLQEKQQNFQQNLATKQWNKQNAPMPLPFTIGMPTTYAAIQAYQNAYAGQYQM